MIKIVASLLTFSLLLGHLPAQSQAVASSSDMQPNSGKGTSQDTTKGIHFVNGLSWQEVLQKAKAENKYIFVDCYATWCGPCKAMDKEV